MRLILVRHGETNHNRYNLVQGWHNSTLSKLGEKQAKKIAEEIKTEPDIIFTSDLRRCLQTLEPLSDKFPSVQILLDWRLRELFFGKLQNKPLSDIDWDNFGSPHSNTASVEPEAYLEERIKSFMRDLSLYDIETAVIFTHGGVMNRFNLIVNPNDEERTYNNAEIVDLYINPNDIRFSPNQKLKPWKLS